LLDAYAANRRRFHLVKLLTPLLLGLPPTAGRAAGPAEGTLGAAATTSAATPTRWWPAGPTATWSAGTSSATPGGCAAATRAWPAGRAAQLTSILLGHHRGVRSWHARNP